MTSIKVELTNLLWRKCRNLSIVGIWTDTLKHSRGITHDERPTAISRIPTVPCSAIWQFRHENHLHRDPAEDGLVKCLIAIRSQVP